MTDLGNSLDLPFEEGPPSAISPNEMPLISGGLTVGSMVADVPEVGLKPGIVFRFFAPDGRSYQPILYVADDDQLAKMRPLINAAVASARRAAATMSREDLPPAFVATGPCPECKQGKHQNCTDQVPSGDDMVDCPCKVLGHQS